MAMISIPAEQASSNLATWWELTGLPPIDHILTPWTDAFLYGASIMFLLMYLVFVFLLPMVKRSRRRNNVSNLDSGVPGAVHVTLEPGSTYNDFRGAHGEFHIHLNDGTKVVSPIPIEVHHHERIGVSDSWEVEVRRADDTIEKCRGDGT
ncbi:MAG: hypothetical protein F4X97_10990 [Boseongicola sp. SB0662_bin_57]|nr:hypothetical protein [Boseongicola sp. SB0662_bin_57]